MSRRLRRDVFIPQAGVIPCHTAAGVQQSRIAHAYVQFGAVIAADGGLGPEVAHRAAAASAEYASLSRGVFSRKNIEVSVKLRAAQAFVDSRLFYNAGTWHRAKSMAMVDKVRRRVYAKLLGV